MSAPTARASAMAVGQENGRTLQGNLLLERNGDHPAVTVAGYHAEGEFGVVLGHLLGVAYHIAQVDNLLGPVEIDGGIHAGQ